MRDLRHVFFGMAAATVAGLALGGAFKPMLRELTDVEGPQMLAGVSGVRTPPGLQQNASWTSYSGDIPDYVIGTDWTQPDAPLDATPDETPPPKSPKPATIAQDEPPVRLAAAPAKYEEEPKPEPSYPSLGGDILAGLQTSYPPQLPEDAPADPPAPAA